MYKKIKQLFIQNTKPDKAEQMAKYMRNKFKFYGLSSAERREVYKDFLSTEKKKKQIDWVFLDQCWEDEHREFQYLVTDYLKKMKTLLTYNDVPKLKQYAKTKQWWDTIDCFDRIIGSIAFKDNRINDLMLAWANDDDFWIRRIAIDHQLGRKEKTNVPLLEQILIQNFGTTEFFINKAIGWSLRDYSKTNPEWVAQFIEKYKDKMSNLSIREGSKYI